MLLRALQELPVELPPVLQEPPVRVGLPPVLQEPLVPVGPLLPPVRVGLPPVLQELLVRVGLLVLAGLLPLLPAGLLPL